MFESSIPRQLPSYPSLEWVGLQLWPSNQYTMRALKYTGKFRVKFGVQIRQLHKDHQDSHYVSALLQYDPLLLPFVTTVP